MIGETFSHYRIIKKLGEGGMGAVFLAEDTELRRNVALKFLPEYYTTKADLKMRFKREAQAAAALNHPAIITVYEVGEYKDSSYIAMEYVEGKSLREIIDSKEMTFERSIEMIVQVGEGLSFAHQHGIVHRDIKPENIMRDKYGRIKILDFGLAKYKGVTRLTREGTTMGTPQYMSPEQVKGQELDHRSDIYSLGVVMYELLSGELPFPSQYEAALLYAIVNEEPTPISKHLPGIPVTTEKLIAKTLQKNVKSRYQKMEEFLSDLKKEKQNRTRTYRPTVLLDTPPRPVAKKKSMVVAALSVVAGVALAFTMIFSDVFTSGESASEVPTQPAENPQNGKPMVENFSGEQAQNIDAKPMESKPTISEPAQPKSTPLDAPAFGVLRIASTPSGADVLLDGHSVGKTPFENKRAAPGFYSVVLKLDGYDDHPQRVRLIEGQTATVSANLTKKAIVVAEKPAPKTEDRPVLPTTGVIEILVKPYGSIFIDGKPKQQDSDRQHTEELPTGRYTVRAVHPTFGVWEKQVAIVAGKTADLTIDFTKVVNIIVASQPVWGDIFVDNQPTGFQTTRQFTLRVGQHAIEVRRDGYDTIGGEKVINFEEDLDTPLVFELRKK